MVPWLVEIFDILSGGRGTCKAIWPKAIFWPKAFFILFFPFFDRSGDWGPCQSPNNSAENKRYNWQ